MENKLDTATAMVAMISEMTTVVVLLVAIWVALSGDIELAITTSIIGVGFALLDINSTLKRK